MKKSNMDQNKEVVELIGRTKYWQAGEDHKEAVTRIAFALGDNDEHARTFRDILLDRRFVPAGRVMVAVGSTRRTTPYNCFVSGTIEDSMGSITERLTQSLQTMRLGGGIGYGFSHLRPSGDRIRSLDSHSCGPVGDDTNHHGFMDLFDAGCATIRSAGHRRGAQMGVLRIDHPDIRHFIRAKRTPGRLTNFNVSIGVTDEFMQKLSAEDDSFDLVFEGRVYETISARALWDEVMRSTWEYAEPGVLFIDRINNKNNLYYCEEIEATNPCGEQPLPPYGACLLGSLNLTRYIIWVDGEVFFDFEAFERDIPTVVRAMDNIIDGAIYPLPEQEVEAKSKRRMGLGITGFANTSEVLGYEYGSDACVEFLSRVLTVLRDSSYSASVQLAKEKGPFPLFSWDLYPKGEFISTLPEEIQEQIREHGIRNSHLLSIAPTGTISLYMDNVSSGIEPVFYKGVYGRNLTLPDGTIKRYRMIDFAEKEFGVVGRTSDECSARDHIRVLTTASKLVDSSVSKTCNVSDGVSFTDFQQLYYDAWAGGASGCTTFRPSAIRGTVISKIEEEVDVVEQGAACYIDEYGNRSCDS